SACSTTKPRSASCSATASRSGASSSTSRRCFCESGIYVRVNGLTYYHPMPRAVAVASHSFPKHETLRRELLDRYPGAVFNESGRPLAGAGLIAFLQGYDKAITGLEVLDEAVFAALPALRVVSKYGVGLDMIDLDAARRHRVAIRWTPGVNRQSVAELAIAFMIALAR